jgi:hypothetical protein
MEVDMPGTLKSTRRPGIELDHQNDGGYASPPFIVWRHAAPQQGQQQLGLAAVGAAGAAGAVRHALPLPSHLHYSTRQSRRSNHSCS